MSRKLGAVPLRGAAGSPSNVAGARPTSMPCFILIHPSNRLATIHQRYRQDRTDRQRSDRVNRFTNGRPKSNETHTTQQQHNCLTFFLLLEWRSCHKFPRTERVHSADIRQRMETNWDGVCLSNLFFLLTIIGVSERFVRIVYICGVFVKCKHCALKSCSH